MSASRGSGPRALRALLAAAALSLVLPGSTAAEVQPVEVHSRPIRDFHIGRNETHFGPLEFVGGLEMTSPSPDLGALSSIRFLTPGGDFIGVADTGFWFFGAVSRDAEGRPSGIAGFRMAQMVDRSGKPNPRKWEVDAEGLAVRNGAAAVGFERRHRISEFRIEPEAMSGSRRNLDFLVPAHELRQNRGFETVAFADEHGPLGGALVIVSEKSLDRSGNIFAAVLDGPRKGVFTVKRSGEFDITDGAFLPNGDLLLLERSFSMATGVQMRLRRIDGKTIGGGMVADGPVLIEADMSFQIDNMEGLDVWRRDDGALIVSLISDDNHSMLQRNLYLEFILHED